MDICRMSAVSLRICCIGSMWYGRQAVVFGMEDNLRGEPECEREAVRW